MAIQSYGPLFYVNGPLPRPPRYTLVGAAEVNPDTDEHWANGIQVHGYIPDVGSIFGVCDPEGVDPKLSQVAPNDLPQYGPLTVYVAEQCSTRSMGTDAEFKARVATVFAAIESGAVEHEFWTGEFLPDNPHLSDGNATILNGGLATSPQNGLALLEAAIAATRRAGMIHVSPDLASALSWGGDVLHDERGKLYTRLGTPVIPGSGYDGSGPTELGATETYAYATGPVGLLRSEAFVMPPEIGQAIDRAQNTIVYRAERYYIPFWDTSLQAGVLIDRCLSCLESP